MSNASLHGGREAISLLAAREHAPREAAAAEPEWQDERRTLAHRAAAFWVNALFWLSWRLPWAVRMSAPFWIWGTWVFSPALRRRTLANARRLLAPGATRAQQRRLGRAVIRSFYLFVHDVARHSHMAPPQIAADIGQLQGQENFDAARSAGRGIIIATAHMGSFEVGIAALRRHEPVVHVVFQRDRMGLFERLRSRLRQTLDVREVAVEEGIAGWMKLREALERNEAVLMQADRVMPGQRGTAVAFLGGTMQLPLGVIKLAALSGAPILPVFTTRHDNGRVDLTIEPHIEPDAPQALYNPAVTPPSLRKLVAVLEKHVAARPDQWLMLRPAWQEDSPAR